jgi:hypothetical protein
MNWYPQYISHRVILEDLTGGHTSALEAYPEGRASSPEEPIPGNRRSH